MLKKFRQLNTLQLILGTAVSIILLFFIRCGTNFAMDRIFRASGKIEGGVVPVSQFQLYGIEPQGDDLYLATDNDPQMIIDGHQKLHTVKFYAQYSILPGEIVMYYTTAPDAPFSEHKRVWFSAVPGQDGWYEAKMNTKDIYSLRIDPTMFAGNIMEIKNLTINEEKTITDFFNISYSSVYILVIYTGIISSCLKFVQEMFTKKSV